MVTATFLTEDSYLGNQTEPLTLNRYNYCVSSYLNYTDPSGNEVEVLESLKGWISNPNTQAQKTIENYENQRLSIEDAIKSGLLNNREGQIFLDYGDVIMGPPVTLPSSLVGIREAIKGNFDSKEMQRTATAGFYAGFVGQGLEYVQIISKADYQLSLLIVTQKGLNAAANPLTYVEYFRNFSPQEKLEAAKRTAKGAWNGEYDSALGRKTGAAILDYLLVAIGGALMKGESAACEVAESGTSSVKTDFYVKPNGEIVPATGYRYMPAEASYMESLKNTMEIPANPSGTYITFDKFDVPTLGRLQVPHDASIRGSFDTLQIIDDIRVPNGKWGQASWLEPITKDFPKYGPGGATQALTYQKIKLNSLKDLSR